MPRMGRLGVRRHALLRQATGDQNRARGPRYKKPRGPRYPKGARAGPTVRLRDASEYPEPARRLFELSRQWFAYDFKEPPAMSRVMAWDPHFGGPHGRAMKRAMAPGEF